MEFKNVNVENLPDFLKSEGLFGQIDLFTIGQALHWLDVDKALETVSSLLQDENQYFLVLGYTKPLINDGSNWQQRMDT